MVDPITSPTTPAGGSVDDSDPTAMGLTITGTPDSVVSRTDSRSVPRGQTGTTRIRDGPTTVPDDVTHKVQSTTSHQLFFILRFSSFTPYVFKNTSANKACIFSIFRNIFLIYFSISH